MVVVKSESRREQIAKRHRRTCVYCRRGHAFLFRILKPSPQNRLVKYWGYQALIPTLGLGLTTHTGVSFDKHLSGLAITVIIVV